MHRHSSKLALALILMATVAVYAGAIPNGFVHDDWASVANNFNLKEISNLGRFFIDPKLFIEGGGGRHTRPVLLVTFALNYLWDAEPAGFRVVNIFIHLANILLLYDLLIRILSIGRGATGSVKLSLLSCAIFAVHPLNTQAIIYISSRSALLAFTFYIAAILAFLRWRQCQEETPGNSKRTLLPFFLLAALAMLTKEHAVSIVGTIYILEVGLFQANRRSRRRLAITLLAASLPVVLYLIYRAAVLPEPGTGGSAAAIHHSTHVKGAYYLQLATQAKALLTYMRLYLWPWGLAIQHDIPQVARLSDPGFLAGVSVVLGSLIWTLPRWWKGSLAATGVLWFIVCMGPESLVRLNMAVNEHRFYLPGIGLIAVTSGLLIEGQLKLERLNRIGSLVARIGLASIIIFLGYRSHAYSAAWKDECSLWAHTARVSPADSWTQNNLGNCLLLQNDPVGAEAAYRAALKLAPDNRLALYNLALALEQQGRFYEAIALYRQFARRVPQARADEVSQKIKSLYERMRNINQTLSDKHKAVPE